MLIISDDEPFSANSTDVSYLQGRLAASLAAAGLSGGCRSIWRQVLAAAGPLQGRYTRPSFNDAAAVEYSFCCLQVLLPLF